MKKLLSIFLAFTFMQTFALTEQEAVEVFWEQFNKKPDNGITSLSRDCVYLMYFPMYTGIGLNLREIHNEECGGDPNFDLSIDYFKVTEDKQLWIKDWFSDSWDWKKIEIYGKERRIRHREKNK